MRKKSLRLEHSVLLYGDQQTPLTDFLRQVVASSKVEPLSEDRLNENIANLFQENSILLCGDARSQATGFVRDLIAASKASPLDEDQINDRLNAYHERLHQELKTGMFHPRMQESGSVLTFGAGRLIIVETQPAYSMRTWQKRQKTARISREKSQPNLG